MTKIMAIDDRQYNAVTFDTYDHKQDEEELWESECKYRLLLDNIPQKIFHKDKDLAKLRLPVPPEAGKPTSWGKQHAIA